MPGNRLGHVSPVYAFRWPENVAIITTLVNSRITTRISPTSGLDEFGAAISFSMAARWPHVLSGSGVERDQSHAWKFGQITTGRGSPGEKDEGKLGAAAGLAKKPGITRKTRSGEGTSGSRLIPEPGSAGVLV